MDAQRNVRPPWIIFADQGKPVAILPAGRAGEVANVEGLSMNVVQAIVRAANAGVHNEEIAHLETLKEKVGLLGAAIRVGIEQEQSKVTLRRALDLLVGYEWHFEDRGGAGEWNVCQACWVEYPIRTTAGAHRPDCQWASTVAELRKLIGEPPPL